MHTHNRLSHALVIPVALQLRATLVLIACARLPGRQIETPVSLWQLPPVDPVPRTSPPRTILQVEFANVILLNKADLIPAEEMDKVEGFVRVLNPTADIKRTVSSEVGLAEIMGTGQFDLDAMSQSAGWVQQVRTSGFSQTSFGLQASERRLWCRK